MSSLSLNEPRQECASAAGDISPDTPEHLHGGRAPKRSRPFIARHACENCRRKKSRCDEEFPCGQCRRSGAECQYGRRRPKKDETNTGAVLDALQRLEARLAEAVRPVAAVQETPISMGEADADASPCEWRPQQQVDRGVAGPCLSTSPLTASETTRTSYSVHEPQEEPILFGGYSILFWPAVQNTLPTLTKPLLETLQLDLPLLLESQRPTLAPLTSQHCDRCGDDWLSQLTVTAVKQLCDAFLSTFNLAYPVIEREFFFQHTLSAAITNGFGFDLASCLVLVVMALGCCGLNSLLKRHDAPENLTLNTSAKDIHGVNEEIPGLAFFNEARRRIGFVTADDNIQSCQYYLLASIFYANLTRPVESWSMITRAGLCLTAHWERRSRMNDWEEDMHSRLYWIALMFENITGTEFNLQATKLEDLKEHVKLPKFVQYESSQSSYLMTPGKHDGDSFYHYHFLSQVAHRIMLSRIHITLFYSQTTGSYPSEALEDELYHQLRVWRDQLPVGLRFDDHTPMMEVGAPDTVLVAAWLPARYHMARYHIGRPRLHRLLHRPDSITENDVQKCGMIVRDILAWMPYAKIAVSMQGCLPLKFTMCCHIFGQFCLLYCLMTSPNDELRESLPEGIQDFCAEALEILNSIAPESPTVAMYAKICTQIMTQLITA